MSRSWRQLHISQTLSLPLEAVMKQHLIVGQSGSGKTNLGVVFVEELAKAHQQFVVIDEPGVWWGLRSSRDGKGDGLSVFILGGEHGDMPLEPTSGAIVADFVVTSGHSFVLDLSLMRRGQVTLFMLDFCSRIYEAKAANKTPLHLVFDESDLYCPEVPHEKGNGKHLLDAIDTIARRGRSRGLQETFITQRPQVINKSIIAQSDVLHVFRLSHPLDRKALDSWVRSNATSAQIETFTTDLASLEQGHCFVWSPEWLKTFKRIHVRQRETFDSSATPQVGVVAQKPKVMTKVDIEGLKAKILETIEVQKAEDPKVLRAQIAVLQRELAVAKEETSRVAGATKEIVTRVEVPVLAKETAEALRSFVDDFAPLIGDLAGLVGEVTSALERIEQRPSGVAVEAWRTWDTSLHESGCLCRACVEKRTARRSETVVPKPQKAAFSRPPKTASSNGAANEPDWNWSPSKCERAILDVLAQRRGQSTSVVQLSMLSGYKISGGFSGALASLRAQGAIEKGEPRITDFGASLVVNPKPMPTGRELLELWLSKLDNRCERAILEAAYSAHPKVLSPTELAKATGYKISGGFSGALATLRKVHLLVERSTRLGPALAETK